MAALVASSQIAIVTVSLARVVTTWNRGAERMLGIAAQEAIDAEATRMVAAEYIDTVKEMFHRCVAGEVTSPSEIRLRRADGTTIDVSLAMSLIVADDGDVLGVSVLSRDITAQKQAEEQARARERAQRRAERHGEIVGNVLVAVERAETRIGRARALLTQIAPALADSAAVRFPDGSIVVGTAEATAWTDEFPMRVGAEIIATLLIAGDRGTIEIEPPDRRAVLIEVAQRCAVLLGQAQRHEQEHEISLRLQRALLPSVLFDDGRFDLDARYVPGSVGLEVGGDWYDAHRLEDGRLMVTVGDVVGHGFEAAAAMGRLRIALAAIAQQTARPSEQLVQLDNFCHGPDGTDFATACIAAIDPATGHMTYASAGHPPILLIAADGTTNFLEDALSSPLGYSGHAVVRGEQEIVVAPGTTVILYTDGLIERRGESLDRGLQRLAVIAVRTVTLDVSAACDLIVSELSSPASNDDIAVLALRRRT